MNIKIYQDRYTETCNIAGTQFEQNATAIKFDFSELDFIDDECVKTIHFFHDSLEETNYIGDSIIQNDEFKIPKSITEYENVLAFVQITKEGFIWKTKVFNLDFYKSLDVDKTLDEDQIGILQELILEVQQIKTDTADEYKQLAEEEIKKFNDNATAKTNTFNSNATTKLNEYNENHTIKMNAYNENSAEKLAEFNENAAEKLEEYDEHIEELDNIVSKNTANGESIYIDDALKYKIFDCKIDGNAEQTTTTGKNYFNACAINNAAIAVENDGQTIAIDVVTDGNGAISTHKTLAELCPNLNVGDQVVLRFNRSLGDTHNAFIYLGNPIDDVWIKGYSKTITEEMLGCEVMLYGNRYIDGETEQCIITDFTIMKTNEANTDFEKFTNNEPSPSPDYKQAITTLNGDIKIVQIGQNAYNIANRKNPDGYPEISVDENDWVTIDNTTPTRHYVNFFTSNLKLKTDTDYAIVLEVKEASGDGKFILMSDDQDRGQFEETIMFEDIGEMGNNSVQVYIKKSKSSFEKSADGLRSFIETSNGQSNFLTFRISVVEDTSITPETFVYKSYESNEYTINLNNNELVKLADDIKDIIEIDKLGNVSLLKNTTKKIFDGTESWYEFDNQYLMNCVRFRLDYDINDINALCDKLQLKLANEYWINDVECLGYSDTSHYIVGQIKKSRLDENASLQSFKDFLAENNLTVYHKTTELTTISLGQLTNFKTYEGVNHFFLEANLATNFEIKYAQDLHKKTDDLQAQINELKTLLSSTATSALLLDNYESDLINEIESEVEQ